MSHNPTENYNVAGAGKQKKLAQDTWVGCWAIRVSLRIIIIDTNRLLFFSSKEEHVTTTTVRDIAFINILCKLNQFAKPLVMLLDSND